MKYFSVSILALLALGSVASAASSVTFISQLSGNYIASGSGVALPDGSLVLIGSFDNVAAIDALPITQIEQAAGWSQFGSTYTTNVIGSGGKLTGSVINNTPEADAFAGEQIFLWVFNAPTVAAATEYGIFTALQADLEWVFSADIIDGNSYLELDDLGLTAYLGSVNGSALSLTAIVPEPSLYAAALGAAGLALVALRRQSQSRRHHG